MSNEKKKIVGEKEKALVDLTLGFRQPTNEKEKRLKEQIDAIKKKGGIVDIPSDI